MTSNTPTLKPTMPPRYFSDLDLANFTSAQGFEVLGEEAVTYSGCSVSGAGDVNGDGYDDIIIGAYYADPNGRAAAGTSYVIFGKFTGFVNIDLASLSIEDGFAVYGARYSDFSGYSVSGAGDVNGDGYDDIIIGAPQADPNGSRSYAGTSYVILGKVSGFVNIDLASLSIEDGFAVYGAKPIDFSGYSVSGAGDVNSDGYDDIIIAAYGASPDESADAGNSYVIFDSSGTFPPTVSPTVSFIPTLDPTTSPSIEPTSPTYNPTLMPTPSPKVSILDNINNFMDSRIFQVTFPVISFFSSLVAGWFLKNKIVFHVLNNWGYSYKLIYTHDLESTKKQLLNQDELGLYIKSDQLFCGTEDKNIAIEVSNGNNAGISSRLYEILAQELRQQSSEPFILMQSEKNQIRDFLLSRGFINPLDLGYIRGTAYNICLNSYKVVHREKYAQQVRIDQDNINQSPLHEQTDNIESRSDRTGDIELRETFTEALEPSNSNNNYENNVHALYNKQSNVVLSIDAMMVLEHVKLQNEEFSRFTSHLINFINEKLPKDINWLLTTQFTEEKLLLEDVSEVIQAIKRFPAENSQFIDSNNLMVSLLSAKQILYSLPLIHYIAQNTINYLVYNLTLPQLSDNKAVLISLDLVLGNIAAQYLPADSIMNGMFISTASTASYAIRLMASDYLKNQEPSEEPVEFAQQCAATIAAYSLPGVVNYVLTKAILPDAKMSISTLDMLGSSSLGVVQCYNNYKAVHGAAAKSTTTDVVVPYIADAITLWSLRGYLNFDSSDTANLMISVKNAMSVATTVYATDCVARMVMDLAPQEVKEEHLDPAFNFVYSAINDIANTCYQSTTDLSVYVAEEAGLIMDYIGAMNLREDA